ncbi:MFS transporter [Amycolatopsis sp. NPDC059657]|uniref:MFS transporter n=1 Tax=Amycolatopsis sp. NPDC059657 TaxID=3346899 RepID=UPI00366F4592
MARSALLSRIAPPPGPPTVLAFGQLTNSVGDGAYYVCSVLYFTRIIGLSPTQIGLGLTIGWAVGFLMGVPLGHLADRFGTRGVATLLALGTSVAVASFLVVRTFPLFLVSVVVYATCQSGLAAARQALLAALVERQDRTKTRAYLQAVTNAGIAIGAAIGGLALQFDTKEAYLAVIGMDAVSFLLSALLVLKLPPVAPVAHVEGEPKLAVLRDKPYALISFLNMIMLLRMPIISLATPLWITQRTNAPTWMVSALLVLNTAAVMLFQVRVARKVTDLKSASKIVTQSGWVMFASCVVFAFSQIHAAVWIPVAILLLAATVQVIGEMQQSAGAWEMSFELAPPDKQGQYQGFFGAGLPVARMLGPLLLVTLIVEWGAPGWILLGVVFLASGLATGPAVRWAERTRPVTPRPAPEPLNVPGAPGTD